MVDNSQPLMIQVDQMLKDALAAINSQPAEMVTLFEGAWNALKKDIDKGPLTSAPQLSGEDIERSQHLLLASAFISAGLAVRHDKKGRDEVSQNAVIIVAGVFGQSVENVFRLYLEFERTFQAILRSKASPSATRSGCLPVAALFVLAAASSALLFSMA